MNFLKKLSAAQFSLLLIKFSFGFFILGFLVFVSIFLPIGIDPVDLFFLTILIFGVGFLFAIAGICIAAASKVLARMPGKTGELNRGTNLTLGVLIGIGVVILCLFFLFQQISAFGLIGRLL